MIRSGVRNVNKVNIPKKRGKFRGKRGGRRITYAQIGNKIYNDVMPVVKLVKRMLNTENKYIDNSSSMGVSSTAGFTFLNSLTQGNSATTRLGDTVKFDWLQWNIVLTINAAATASRVRVCILRDEQSNGANPATTDYMNSGAVTSLTNFKEETRFFTFVDEIVTLDSNGPQVLCLRGSKNLGFHTNYGLGNAGTVADITKNSLFMYSVSNEATNTVSMEYNIRLLFVDN